MIIYSISAILILVTAVRVLVKFYKFIRSPSVPESPAALGASISAMSFILACALFVLYFAEQVIGSVSLLLYSAIPITVLFLVLSGYLSVKTSENTAGMNIKLTLVIGLIPHFLVTSLAFISLPGWVNYINMAIYIPCILAGSYLYKRITNKAVLRAA